MNWIPVFAIPMAIALIKLGALSVWVYVLSAALTVTTAVIAEHQGATDAQPRRD